MTSEPSIHREDKNPELEIEMKNVSLDLPLAGKPTGTLQSILSRLNPKRTTETPSPCKTIRVLDEISLSLESGDRIGLLGHNGAGKSSLLRLLGKIYWPTTGEFTVKGHARCLFGLNPGMEEEASGYENITILSRVLGYPKTELKNVRADVENFCELKEALSRPVRTYSDGMRLRLCFGVITARPADILLIDEVIGVGDRDFKEKATQRMKNLISNSGILVLASHDTDIINSFCTESIRLEKGRIIERTSLRGN